MITSLEWIAVGYGVMSAATFLAFASDKRAAPKPQNPEKLSCINLLIHL